MGSSEDQSRQPHHSPPPGEPVAHSPNDDGQWDLLADHIREVAQLAHGFAAAFNMGVLAYLAGLWHDLGKYSQAFQRYLLRAVGLAVADREDAELTGKVDHSTAGAQHAMNAKLPKPFGRLLAYMIAGHHAGLLDAGNDANADIPGTLAARLRKPIPPLGEVPREILEGVALTPPAIDLNRKDSRAMAFQVAFMTRMIFSALVDADYLATEAHANMRKQLDRSLRPADWLRWSERIDQVVRNKQQAALDKWGDSPLLRLRRRIYDRCCQQALLAPGFFSLTVPTGGGKTISSFAMAVRHLIAHQASHGLRRVIYAMPFTSIIEQNAQVLRDLLGDDADLVLEHHSNLDPERITPWNKLASENWDAPLIVTTTVQLYESLFACRTSACRKLHRIAGSVIVLDEAQSLPVELLQPTLAALAELVRNYNCTVILCTATQPAIARREGFPIGLEGVREVMEDPADLARQLRRVEINDMGEQDAVSLARQMAVHRQALAIVDTRARAAELYQQLQGQGAEAFHLSAAMCPAHRSQVLQMLRKRLDDGLPCRVVSTQLIEAGVDIDFPVVYRALAGLDSIAQAAGRCNREGRLHRGQVHVFHYTGGAKAAPPGMQRHAADAASQIIGLVDDLLSPEAQQRYFKLLYWDRSGDWDKKEVMDCFKEPGHPLFNFKSAAERYRLIDQNQKPVLIPWGEQGEALLARVLDEHQPLGMKDYRLMQRYQVQVPIRIWNALVANGEVQDLPERISVLLSSKRYDKHFGLRTEDVVPLSGEDLVV